MKWILLLFSGVLIFITSCSKSTIEAGSNPKQGIEGNWRFYQQFFSYGGPLVYEPTLQLKQWITFTEDGKFSSNMPEFKNIQSFEQTDSIRFTFRTAAPVTESHYFINQDQNTHILTISSADYICIEGCGLQFKR